MTTPPTSPACLSCGDPYVLSRQLCNACYLRARVRGTLRMYPSCGAVHVPYLTGDYRAFTGIPDNYVPRLKTHPDQPGLVACAYTSTEMAWQCDRSTGRYAPWHYTSPFAPTQAELDAESNTGRAA